MMHRHAPKALTAALAASAVLLTACGGDNKDKSKSTSSTATTATTRTSTVPRTPTVARRTTATSRAAGAGVAAQATRTSAEADTTSTTGTVAVRAAGQRPFSRESPWNTVVTDAAIDPKSSALIRSATLRLGVNEGQNLDVVKTNRRVINEPLFINTDVWTDPVVDSQDQGVPTKIVCRQINLPPPNNDCGDGWAVSQLDIPADEDPVPENDGWFTVTDRSKGIAYDLWRARRAADGSSISYQFLRQWDLNGPGFLAPNTVSARGSGLPLFGGLITLADIRAGKIEHALAMSVPGPAAQNYVQPASVTDGNGPFDSLPEGARIRLKRSVSINRLLSENPGIATGLVNANGDEIRKKRAPFPGNTNRRAARAVLTALRDYGAIIVDRAATPTLYAQRNVSWTDPLRRPDGALLQANGRTLVSKTELARTGAGTPLLRGSEVQGLYLTDFEVVTLPPLRRDPPLENTSDVATARLGAVSPQQTPTVTTGAPASATAGSVAGTGAARSGAATSTSATTTPQATRSTATGAATRTTTTSTNSSSTTPRTTTSTSTGAAGVSP